MSSLIIGNLPFGPDSGGPQASNRFSSEHKQNPYRGWKAVNEYIFDSGLISRGVAMPGSSGGTKTAAAITQAHGGVMWRRFTGVAQREGAVPTIPDPTTSDANEVLADQKTTVESPDSLAEGGPLVFTLRWEYWYLLKTYVAPQDQKFVFPAPPFLTNSPDTVPAGAFRTGLT